MPTELYRHIKRQTLYRVLDFGRIQISTELKDGDPVVIYQSIEDGAVWVRSEQEMEDPNRFEKIGVLYD